MKSVGFLLLIPAGWASIAGAAETPSGLVSSELKANIREGLPAYQPPPANKPATEGETPGPINSPVTDPSILILPKFLVKEKRLPADATDHLMSRSDFNRKMRNLYDDDLAKEGPLQALLNKYTIPLFSPSRVQKGRALALGRELDRLADLLSPEEAKSLNGMYDELAGILGRRAPKRR